MIVLASGGPDGVCYIETSQLDGETNLKLRKAPKMLLNLSVDDLVALRGIVNVDTPSHHLYEFKGNIEIRNDTVADLNVSTVDLSALAESSESTSRALTNSSFLMRASVVRNTPWVIGMVVYAGPETKLSLNQKDPPSKFSSLDRRINKYVVGLFIFQCLLCIGMAIQAAVFTNSAASRAWYLALSSDEYVSPGVAAVITFFSYFVIMSYVIPISLVVSLEITKVVQAKFMEWDEQMFLNGEHMEVKTTNLNDELALVEHIFSDKTGTLTENQMDFRRCSVRGLVSADKTGGVYEMFQMESHAGRKALIRDYLLAMAVCHSVVCDVSEDGEVQYKAPSPDEEALCDGARDNEAVLLERNSDGCRVRLFGEEIFYEVLCELPFTSERRRMSVLVRLPNGRHVLYCKGADHIVKQRLLQSEQQSEDMRKTVEDLQAFSVDGLRTLLFARKQVSEEEVRVFQEEFQAAEALIDGRDDAVAEVCDRMERDLELLGCSAIEDRLQDGVPETIAYLMQAGIKVWVITGDKEETAINIGYSTHLLNQKMKLLKFHVETSQEFGDMLNNYLTTYCPDDAFQELVELSSEDPLSTPELAIIISGSVLKFAIEDYPEQFLRLTRHCRSVICNRVAPLQKALVVRLVKEGEGRVCLAIGDGANDVSMIQEANIGVGIFGEEGTQAARNSDYALQRFRHLRRLVAVHGRYALVRNAALTHYSFYKNVAMFLVQIWFSIFCGASAQPIYDDWLMTFFNITITSLPPFAVGMFEKDISEEIIERHPESYQRTQRNTVFTMTTLALWMASATYHSLVFFFTTYPMFVESSLAFNGQMGGLYVMGNWIFAGGLFVLFFKFALEVETWNIIIHLALWLSVLCYFATVLMENFWFAIFPEQYGVVGWMFQQPTFWLWAFACVVLCMIPDVTLKFLRRELRPAYYQLLQERYRHSSTAFYHPLGDDTDQMELGSQKLPFVSDTLSEHTPLVETRRSTSSYSTEKHPINTPPTQGLGLAISSESPWKATNSLPAHHLPTSYGAL
mmetsp:Transcript_23132/g.57897  ORF Transcript_23132/g.57897 Transcript_23132/m.57897 type:complete len:1024 (+) Transcript_23132:91-3162(+)